MAAKDSPLKQFEIVPFSKTELGGYDISFTNSSLSMIITVAVITLFLTLTVNPCLLYTSPSPRDGLLSRMPSSA